MNIEKISIFSNENIGLFTFTNDKYTLVPPGLERDLKEKIAETLKTEIIETTVSKSVLIGLFVNGNNNVILLPRTIDDDELIKLKTELKDVRVEVLNIKPNALGNTMLLNDNGGLLFIELTEAEVKEIVSALQMDNVKKGTIANVVAVGSAGVVTDFGGLVHADASQEEVADLEKLFKTKIEIGTVNFGNAYVKTGLVVNRNGILVGSETTGPEILRIQQTFSL
ncbi:MAG: translation initiation factor IF-6 [Sulfolobus sp.]|jgi:translation initiation factor 6|nr:translation initiation factor IF-6 [Sulfolobus sp.]